MQTFTPEDESVREARHLLLASVGISLLAFSALTCSWDKGADSPPGVHVAGQVLSYTCGVAIGAPEEELYSDTMPYSAQSGLPAEIEFTSETGYAASLETDNLSTFGLFLPAGLYSIKIETDHTRPDYFDSVSLTADTILSLVIRQDYSTADLIYLAFCYEENGSFPLSAEEERALLEELNDEIGGLLLLDAATRFSSSCVLYRIPTLPERKLWEVVQAVAYQLGSASPHPALRLSVPGYSLCPEDFVIFGPFDTTFVVPFDSLVVEIGDSIILY